MWAVIGGWVRTLVVIVLIGNLVDIVLPKGDLRRYAGLVVGIILLAVMIRPLVSAVAWINREHESSAFNWATQGPSLSGAIANEERHQAEAMVETVPGVVDCQLQVTSSTQVIMLIRVQKAVSTSLVKAMANQAVSLTLGSNMHLQGIRIESQS